jgi:hypothetical protein
MHPYFELIRKVSHRYSAEAEKAFFENRQMSTIFYHFGTSSEIGEFIESQMQKEKQKFLDEIEPQQSGKYLQKILALINDFVGKSALQLQQ